MITRRKSSHSHVPCWVFAVLVMLFNARSAGADAHLSVRVSDFAAFRNYFWIDGYFGGLLSDFIKLRNGIYNIELFGPLGPPERPLTGMFYATSIMVAVANSKPAVRSISFNSYCTDKGIESYVKKWPTPVIMPDANSSTRFFLVVASPTITKRHKPCEPPLPPALAPWTNIGVLKLITTSTPVGAEVWVGGDLVGKTNQTINVPYHNEREKISVVIRMRGYVSCQWTLEGPFKPEAPLACSLETP
jgi:hypothetical protein